MSIHDHYLRELARAQHREAVRQCDPTAIRSEMAAAGVSLPLVEGAYRIGAQRVLDQADVATWYAVQTAPNMERRAADELRGLGHACRVPMREYLRQSRRKAADGKFVKEPVQVALCTGYAFLGLARGPVDWRAIRARDGVVSVVSHDGLPQPIVRTDELFRLFDADDAGAFKADADDWSPQPGDPVRVAGDHPLGGLVGRILRTKGDAAKIVLDALFGGVEVDVSLGKLEAVP